MDRTFASQLGSQRLPRVERADVDRCIAVSRVEAAPATTRARRA
jgi:hypothetical protein